MSVFIATLIAISTVSAGAAGVRLPGLRIESLLS